MLYLLSILFWAFSPEELIWGSGVYSLNRNKGRAKGWWNLLYACVIHSTRLGIKYVSPFLLFWYFITCGIGSVGRFNKELLLLSAFSAILYLWPIRLRISGICRFNSFEWFKILDFWLLHNKLCNNLSHFVNFVH